MCGVGAAAAIPNTNVAGASGGGATNATAPTAATPPTAPSVPGSAVAGAAGGGATLPVGAAGALGGAAALPGTDTSAIASVLTSLVGVLNQLVQALQNGALGGGGAIGGGAPGKTPVQSPMQASPVQGGGGNQVTGTMTAVGTDSISVRDAAGKVQTLKVEAGSVVAGKLEHLKEHLALNWGVNVTVENRNGVAYATNVADYGAKPAPAPATGGGAAMAAPAAAPVAAAAHDESVPHGH